MILFKCGDFSRLIKNVCDKFVFSRDGETVLHFFYLVEHCMPSSYTYIIMIDSNDIMSDNFFTY